MREDKPTGRGAAQSSVMARSAEGGGILLQFFNVRRIMKLCDFGVLRPRDLQKPTLLMTLAATAKAELRWLQYRSAHLSYGAVSIFRPVLPYHLPPGSPTRAIIHSPVRMNLIATSEKIAVTLQNIYVFYPGLSRRL
jgi:hypothetical protein